IADSGTQAQTEAMTTKQREAYQKLAAMRRLLAEADGGIRETELYLKQKDFYKPERYDDRVKDMKARRQLMSCTIVMVAATSLDNPAEMDAKQKELEGMLKDIVKINLSIQSENQDDVKSYLLMQ